MGGSEGGGGEVGEQRRPELRRELANRRVEAGQPREGAIGGGGLEDVRGQHRVPARPRHLLPLVLHPPVLEPDLDRGAGQEQSQPG